MDSGGAAASPSSANARRILRRAAVMFAAYHCFIYGFFAYIFIVWPGDARSRGSPMDWSDPVSWFVTATSGLMALGVVVISFGISYDLWRLFERGRQWFFRWISIEMGVIMSVGALLPPGPGWAARAGLYDGIAWRYVFCLVVCLAFWFARAYFAYRMRSAEVTRVLR